MALTTTAVNGCDAGIYLDDSAGTPVDIGGSTNGITLNFTQNVAELRAYGSKWPTRLSCGKDATVNLVVIYSETADEGLDILKDWFFASSPGSRTLTIYLPDKNVGSDKYSGEFVIQDFSIPSTAGEAAPIAVAATLLCNGEVTMVTNAT